MGRPKPSKPRVIGAGIDQQAIDRLAPEERGNTYAPSGTVTPIKRRSHVFNILRDSGSLSRNQAAAAVRLMGIYTTLAGVGEAPERDDVEDYFVRTELDPAHAAVLRARGMIAAESDYRRACQRIGPLSAALLTMLYRDFMEGDHEPPVSVNGRVVPRWRVKVRAFFKERGRVLSTPNEEAFAVWMACEELQRVV